MKPPKTMQPEAVDLAKAGRDKSKAFGEDSFHSYMARKIDRQRQQFGLMVPPAPPPQKGKEATAEKETKVRFAPDTAPEKKRKKRKHKFGITSVLKRLQRRHGEHSNKKRKRGEEQRPTELSQQSVSSEGESNGGSVVAQREPPLSEMQPHQQAAGESEKRKQHKPSRPDLFFTGVVVLVNGYTNPDTETLQRLLHRHGGDLEKYETSRITHILAERLSQAKATMYAKRKNAPAVCQPSWIVDSVRAGKLLPVTDYLVIREDEGTKSVASFFQTSTTVAVVEQQQQQQQPRSDSEKKERHGVESSSYSETPHLSQESLWGDDEVMADPIHGDVSQRAHVVERSSYVAAKDTRTDEQPTKGPERAGNPTAANPTMASDPQKERYINGRIRTVGTDPHFLESFFAASRLSFIGSYKQRARQSPTKSGESRSTGERFVFHVDMDSFFASVVLRNFPQYRDKPVVISHHGENAGRGSGSTGENSARDIPKDSSSECATCNYEARKYGIKKGMYLGRAKALCSDLIILQYDFEGYKEVSDVVSDILERYAAENAGYVEHVSCDEAYVEFYLSVSEGSGSSPRSKAAKLAESIRTDIFEATQCTATVGVGTNKLLAKLATDHVKPNRSFVVDEFRDLLRPLQLRELHGVGYRLEHKLAEEDLVSVQDVWDLGNRGEHELCRILGPGLGKKIYGFCQGKDDRPVQPAERKTIGAECNYGVRFDGPFGVDHMVEGLCREVEHRMSNVAVKGSKITLKVKQRKENAPPPPKFLGHGSCHNLSKSQDIGNGPTREWKYLHEVAMQLLAGLDVPKEDIRGMGIVISKLVEHKNSCKEPANSEQDIANWFARKVPTNVDSSKENQRTRKSVEFSLPPVVENENGLAEKKDKNEDSVVTLPEQGAFDEARSDHDEDFDIALPALSQIHMSQVEELPSPMRKQVVSKMESARASEADPSEESKASPQNNHSARMYRQTDVKRMFRLAALKSGAHELAEETAVSLTQLADLPLEVQLQVANDDQRKVGALSPEKRSKRSTTTTRRRFNASSAEKPKRMSPTVARVKQKAREKVVEPSPTPTPSSATAETFALTGPCDFYRDNVLPLSVFMDENSDASIEAQQQVIEFLILCVAEHRLQDVVVLLKSIQNRKDAWGSSSLLETIFSAVDAKVEECCGASLDREWVLRG